MDNMELSEFVIWMIFAGIAGHLLPRVFGTMKKSKPEVQLKTDNLEPLRYRALYFSRLKEGRGQGFVVLMIMESSDAIKWPEVAERARDLFYRKFLRSDIRQGIVPESHYAGTEYSLNGFLILVGHPIPVAIERQLELLRSYIRGWFECIDETTGGMIKGVVSIAYGDIIFQVREGDLGLGSFSGLPYNAAVRTLADTLLLRRGQWPDTGSHRIAVNDAAAALLLKERPSEVHIGYDGDPPLYAADWSAELLTYNGKI